jgi:hypothetical protein
MAAGRLDAYRLRQRIPAYLSKPRLIRELVHARPALIAFQLREAASKLQ